MSELKWFEINNAEDIISPSLVVYPDRIERNIKLMIQIAEGVDSLRPHIKTHKIAEILEMQLKHGIYKFKCATISEAALLAKCGAKDILIAIQPVGKNVDRFFDLIEKYPDALFSTIVDNETLITKINDTAAEKQLLISLWLDINNGMNRTGILPDKNAVLLYEKINQSSNLDAKGLHVYDGHIQASDINLRKQICDSDFEKVLTLKEQIELLGIEVKTIVAGGTPSFPIHAKRSNVEVSPGTTLLWDQRYAEKFKDLKFSHAAILIGNIISKPASNLLCLNLGHKSVAAEMDFPRLEILNFQNCKQIRHSEEHLVVECNESEKYTIGDVCYAVPMHICPTVIKYDQVLTVNNGKISGHWKVAARDYLTN